ncbi:hypothetical protein ElyMa_001989900 [Elysia marginata]|uniref:Uncharacterized protein n=1 Tax=Elysia marginata TaxID=1093978 RepID=A0AAV4F3Y5_9GAST|nr:hypothetical protein ElyMa_001989900 [Elysia marginata]
MCVNVYLVGQVAGVKLPTAKCHVCTEDVVLRHTSAHASQVTRVTGARKSYVLDRANTVDSVIDPIDVAVGLATRELFVKSTVFSSSSNDFDLYGY